MQFTQRCDKCSNAYKPIFKFRPCQLFVLLVFVVNIPNSTEKMLTLCYQCADMLYENHYFSKCHDEAYHDVFSLNKESNMCKGNGMH